MSQHSSSEIWYVYGIVAADGALATPPAGLDESAVALEHAGGRVAALVSVLDHAEYGPDSLETNTADVEWLSPRAVAHDRVLTWASDRGPVIPLPMFTVFSGRNAVHSMLRDRAAQLSSVLERVSAGREYALRVYRVDSELLSVIATLSPRLEALSREAAAASPGQRYLLERKLEAEKKAELRVVTSHIVDDIVESLTARAVDVVRSPIPKVSASDAAAGTMVLSTAFLVASSEIEAFQRVLTEIVDRDGPRGFRFDFTGPWPPYHFAQGGASDHGA